MKAPGTYIATVVAVLTVPSYIIFFLRCYVRWTRKSWGLEDWCMATAIPLFTWLVVSCISGALHGFGLKDEDFTGGTAQIKQAMLDWFNFGTSYTISTIPVKLSIAAQQIRIAAGRPSYVWPLRSLMGLYSLFLLGACIYNLFHCRPLKYMWDKSIPGGKCANPMIITNISYAILAFNILTDWTCALVPIPLLWNVKMNRNAKIAAGILLGLGFFASICAIVRLKYIISLSATRDFFYGTPPLVAWTFSEISVGMIGSNLSTLRPLFARLILLGGSTAARSNGNYPNVGSNKRSARGWHSGPSTQHSLHAGAIELDDRSARGVHTVVESGHVGSAESESSIGDDESGRRILRGDSTALGGIRVRHEIQLDRTPAQ
ncbi:hypothetical protein B0J12DRAFT_579605 [Macrophomina phaseolina]|uniref:Rhodopsin domain-containing protein n=1 Tax=Macrophomina phaseolina TaxID=35725 RepID=A0ABQ8G1T3_9PEZI|nr:hypothetical protein B0J12DRAFT_579605 [Macrophomina phaseolina]